MKSASSPRVASVSSYKKLSNYRMRTQTTQSRQDSSASDFNFLKEMSLL